MQEKADFEGVGDSELLNPPICSTVAPSIDADADAAKSTSGSIDNDGDGDSNGDVISCSSSSSRKRRRRKERKERKEGKHRKGEERRISWRSWLIEYAARCDAIGDETGSTTTAAAAGAEAERNRLFWEACFAHGY